MTTHDPREPRRLSPGVSASYRALRTLELLLDRTDATTCITFKKLHAELQHPSDRGATPVPGGRKTLFAALEAIRMAGFDIERRGWQGYTLKSRPIADEEIREIAEILLEGDRLHRGHGRYLVEKLLALAGPNLREEFGARLAKLPKPEAPPLAERARFALVEPETLIEWAIERAAPISFELISPEEAAAPSSGTRVRMFPRHTVERGGSRFVLNDGACTLDPRAAPARLFRLDRMRNVIANMPDGMALFAAVGPPGKPVNTAKSSASGAKS